MTTAVFQNHIYIFQISLKSCQVFGQLFKEIFAPKNFQNRPFGHTEFSLNIFILILICLVVFVWVKPERVLTEKFNFPFQLFLPKNVNMEFDKLIWVTPILVEIRNWLTGVRLLGVRLMGLVRIGWVGLNT